MLDIERMATFASVASILGRTETTYIYPKDAIDKLWEDVLLCQFHDVVGLPLIIQYFGLEFP